MLNIKCESAEESDFDINWNTNQKITKAYL